MGFVHGKDSGLKLDNVAGTLTDISAYVDNVGGLPGDVELADVSALGDEGHRFVPGLENAQVSISGHWDSAEDAIFGSPAQWKSATRTFEFGPAGTAVSSVKYSGEAWITNYTVTGAVGDKVSWSATLQVDGQVARGTF